MGECERVAGQGRFLSVQEGGEETLGGVVEKVEGVSFVSWSLEGGRERGRKRGREGGRGKWREMDCERAGSGPGWLGLEEKVSRSEAEGEGGREGGREGENEGVSTLYRYVTLSLLRSHQPFSL